MIKNCYLTDLSICKIEGGEIKEGDSFFMCYKVNSASQIKTIVIVILLPLINQSYTKIF